MKSTIVQLLHFDNLADERLNFDNLLIGCSDYQIIVFIHALSGIYVFGVDWLELAHVIETGKIRLLEHLKKKSHWAVAAENHFLIVTKLDFLLRLTFNF